MGKDFERVKEDKKINPKDFIAKVRTAAELEPLDYVIMVFIKNALLTDPEIGFQLIGAYK